MVMYELFFYLWELDSGLLSKEGALKVAVERVKFGPVSIVLNGRFRDNRVKLEPSGVK